MNKFIKLFEYEEYGQVAVIRGEVDDDPALRIFYKPPGLGICEISVGFYDDESADRSFNFMTQEDLKDVIKEQFGVFGVMAKEEG